MRLSRHALVLGILPPVLMHVCHAISAAADLMPWCVPYLEGCVSVSAAGRHPPANHLFDAVMIPCALGLMLLWSRLGGWLGSYRLGGRWIAAMGVAAGTFMVVYAVFLGVEEGFGPRMRRIGINGYFLFNMLAQAGLAGVLLRRADQPIRRRARSLAAFWLAAVAMGMLSAFEDIAGLRSNRIDNVIEWSFALFMSLYFVALSRIVGNETGLPGTRSP